MDAFFLHEQIDAFSLHEHRDAFSCHFCLPPPFSGPGFVGVDVGVDVDVGADVGGQSWDSTNCLLERDFDKDGLF